MPVRVHRALHTRRDAARTGVDGLSSELGPLEQRGRYLSTFQMSFAPANVVAPAAFTTLFAWHVAAPWLVIGGVSPVAGLVVLGLEPRLPVAAVHPGAAARTATAGR